MWSNKTCLGYAIIGSLFIILGVKLESPPPSPSPSSSSSPPPSPSPSSSPSSSSPSSLQSPPPSPSPISPGPSSTLSSPTPGSALDPTAALKEVQSMFNIIKRESSSKDVDLYEIYSTYKTCPDRIAIESAYRTSRFNFDSKKAEDQGSNEEELSDEDKDKFRLFMATFLSGCDTGIFYSYHLKELLAKDDSVRGITAILVASTESEELQTSLRDSFNERFGNSDADMIGMVEDALEDSDTKNFCIGLIDIKREEPLVQVDTEKVKTITTELVEEEKVDHWSDNRQKLDSYMIKSPLNELKLVVEGFKVDGKDMKKTAEENFADDEDKKVAYIQLIDLVSYNISFHCNELYYGLQENDIRYPMRVFGVLKQKNDFAEIEKKFKETHSDFDLRQKITEVASNNCETDYVGKFFQKVLEEHWGNSAASPASSSPSTSPSESLMATSPTPSSSSPPPPPPPPSPSPSPISPPPPSPSPPSPSPPPPLSSPPTPSPISPPPPSPSPPSPSPPPPPSSSSPAPSPISPPPPSASPTSTSPSSPSPASPAPP